MVRRDDRALVDLLVNQVTPRELVERLRAAKRGPVFASRFLRQFALTLIEHRYEMLESEADALVRAMARLCGTRYELILSDVERLLAVMHDPLAELERMWTLISPGAEDS